MFFPLLRIPLFVLIFVTSAAIAMEKSPAAQETGNQKPVLPADLSPENLEAMQKAIIISNEIETPEAQAMLKRQCSAWAFLGIPLVELALAPSMGIFIDQINKAKEYAQQYVKYTKLHEPHIPAETILLDLTNQLSKLSILDGATQYHTAMLVSDDPTIKDWLEEEIENSTELTDKAQSRWIEKTKKPYELSPLFLAAILDNQSILNSLKEKGITIKNAKPSRFQANILSSHEIAKVA